MISCSSLDIYNCSVTIVLCKEKVMNCICPCSGSEKDASKARMLQTRFYTKSIMIYNEFHKCIHFQLLLQRAVISLHTTGHLFARHSTRILKLLVFTFLFLLPPHKKIATKGLKNILSTSCTQRDPNLQLDISVKIVPSQQCLCIN